MPTYVVSEMEIKVMGAARTAKMKWKKKEGDISKSVHSVLDPFSDYIYS